VQEVECRHPRTPSILGFVATRVRLATEAALTIVKVDTAGRKSVQATVTLARARRVEVDRRHGTPSRAHCNITATTASWDERALVWSDSWNERGDYGDCGRSTRC
jgi:hypothetical protein